MTGYLTANDLVAIFGKSSFRSRKFRERMRIYGLRLGPRTVVFPAREIEDYLRDSVQTGEEDLEGSCRVRQERVIAEFREKWEQLCEDRLAERHMRQTLKAAETEPEVGASTSSELDGYDTPSGFPF